MKSSSKRCDIKTATQSMLSLLIKKPNKDALQKAQSKKSTINFQEITDVINAISPSQRPPTEEIVARIKKNIPYANEITGALLYLCKNNIALSYNTIELLTTHGKYAVEIAKAFVYLNKSDIFMTQRNIDAIADAEELAMQVATAIVWFITNINSNIHLVSEILDALAFTHQVNDLILAFALLDSSRIPLTKTTIAAVTNASNPIELSLKVISLKKEGEEITDNLITRLAKTHTKSSESSDQTTYAPTDRTEKTKEQVTGLIENYFLNSPSNTQKVSTGIAQPADAIVATSRCMQ